MPRKKKATRKVTPEASSVTKGFVPRPVFKEDVDEIYHDDAEGIRLERARKVEVRMFPERPMEEEQAVKKIGGRKIMYILEESPNEFKITVNAPADPDSAIMYYSNLLRMYKLRNHPEEFGLIQYQLALLFSESNRKPNLHISNVRKDLDNRAKMIENTLFHLNKARQVFSLENYPMMFAVICTLTGQMLRERTTLMTNRCFVNTGRGTISECINRGLEQLLEAFEVFANARHQSTEHAISALEVGWLYLLQAEQEQYKGDPLVREQSITYLERAIALVQETKNPFREEKPRLWDPQDPSTHPKHIRVLLLHRPLSFVEGAAMFLLGRVYMEWGLQYAYQMEAFNYFNMCIRPKFLTSDSEYWGEAHHKAAVVILQCPQVVDPDYVKPADLTGPGAIYPSELYLDSAISHLSLSLRCTALSGSQLMDIYFHRAQANMVKFYNITDKVPAGASILNALLDVESHGLEIMEAIEDNLLSAIELVTPANTQSPQDGLIYYFSCLKLADFRILEAGIKHKKDSEERDALIRDALAHIVNALLSRSLEENMDLHHLAICQLSQLIFSARRGHAASKCYAKALMSFSGVTNRCNFHEAYVKQRVQDDLQRLTSQAMLSCSRYITWEKKHLGSLTCNGSITPGYASWSFEAEPTWGENAVPLRSAEDRAPPREAPRSNLQVVPIQTMGAIDRTAAAQSLDDTGSVMTGELQIQGRVTVNDSSSSSVRGRAGLTSLNLHAVKKREPSAPRVDGDFLGDEEDSVVGSSPVKRPKGLPPLSAYGLKPHLNSDGSRALTPYSTKKRRRVPWPGEYEYEHEKEMLMAQSKPMISLTSLLPTHSNIRIGKEMEKSFDKGFARRREKVRVNEGDEEEEDEDENDNGDEEDDQDENASPRSEKTDAKKKPDNNNKDPKGAWRTSGKETKVRSKRVKLLGTWDNNKSSKYDADKKKQSQEPVSSWDRESDDSDPEAVDVTFMGRMLSRARTLFYEGRAKVIGTYSRASESVRKVQRDLNRRIEALMGPPKVTVRGGDMWASKAAWYTLMILSRQARLQLVIRSNVLNAVKGERTRVVIKEFSPEMQRMYNSTKKQLFSQCKQLIIMPQTLRELMSRPFQDLRAIFESQTTLYKLCCDMEDVMGPQYMGHPGLPDAPQDCFVPFIHLAPCLCRDLEAFDRSMYDVESFSNCMKYEAEVMEQKAKQRYDQVHSIEEKERRWGETHYAHPSTASVSRRFQATNGSAPQEESVDGQSLGSSGQVLGGESVQGRSDEGEGLLRSFPQQQPTDSKAQDTAPTRQARDEEAKEDAKLGKMTYSFSHILDGSFEGDIRKTFSQHLSANDMLMAWHLPGGANQSLMVVLAWRQQVMPLGRTAAVTAAAEATEGDADLDQKLSDQYVFKPGMKRSGNHAHNHNGSKHASEKKLKTPLDTRTWEDKTADELEKELGIVVEVARCDLELAQLQHYLAAYMEALQSKPQPKRQSHVADALRVLSGQLAVGELLTMAPPSVSSIVICCPPLLRLVPWHLLLIDSTKQELAKRAELQESYVKPDVDSVEKLALGAKDSAATSSTNGGNLGTTESNKPKENKGANARAPQLNDEGVISVHLVEKYLVRLGPSLAVWEMCCRTANQFSHAVGLHRLVAINGESLEKSALGIRSAATEISCVTATFSGDPDDCKVFAGQSAVPHRLRTMFAGSAHLTRPVVVGERRTDEDAMMELGRLKAERVQRRLNKKKEVDKKKTKKAEQIKQQADAGRYVLDHSSSEESESESSSSDDEEIQGEKMLQTIRLSTCRVLHIAALRSTPHQHVKEKAGTAAITLPTSYKAAGVHEAQRLAREQESLILGDDDPNPTTQPFKITKKQAEYLKDSLNAKDVISQLFLRNCGLCVLSRFGLTDGQSELNPRVVDNNLEFLEALHMAGATSLMYPLWSGNAQGALGTLGSLLFQIHFYTELPSYSARRYSIAHACRKAQLWLKDATGNDVLTFLNTAPLPKKTRTELIEEMTSYIITTNKAAEQQHQRPGPGQHDARSDYSISTYSSALQRAPADPSSSPDSKLDRELKALNAHNLLTGVSTEAEATMYSALPSSARPKTAGQAVEELAKAQAKEEMKDDFKSTPGGERTYFSNILYWGAFVVSGHGGNIHHPDLSGDEERAKADLNKGTREFQDDPELKNMAFEVRFLKMEGRVDEAYELEQVMRRMEVNRIKKRMQKIREAGLLAGRAVMDGLDRLDKAFLDQDSDEVSVSDDEEHKARSPAASSSSSPAVPRHRLRSLRAVHDGDALNERQARAAGAGAGAGEGAGVDEDGEGGDGVDVMDGMEGREEIDERLLLRSELIRSQRFPRSSEVRVPQQQPSKKGEKSRSRRVMKSGKSSRKLDASPGPSSVRDNDDESSSQQQMEISALGVTKAAIRNARDLRAGLQDARETIGKEVRSYADATQTAQEMLSKLPARSVGSKSCIIQ